jgi:hypothetical protein
MKTWVYRVCFVTFLIYLVKNSEVIRDSSGNVVKVIVNMIRVSDSGNSNRG